MATIKKISGVGDVGTLTTDHRLLVEAPNGTLGSTTVGAVNNHTHSYAGSASAGGPANDFVAGLGSDNVDRYVYFAYNDETYNNSNASSITKGKAVVDSEFKYNPSTNTLTVGTVKGNLSGNAASSSSMATSSQLTSATEVNGFLGSGIQYTSFKNYTEIGFGGNDGMMVSFPWPGNTSYGAQIAFDDSTTGLVKVRGKGTSWGSWKQLWKEGDSITAPSITATNGFTGDLTGDVTGNASTTSLSNGTTDASRYIIFQDAQNSTSKLTACYDADFKYNPVSNLMNVGSVQLNSKVTLQYNSSTESLDFVFA